MLRSQGVTKNAIEVSDPTFQGRKLPRKSPQIHSLPCFSRNALGGQTCFVALSTYISQLDKDKISAARLRRRWMKILLKKIATANFPWAHKTALPSYLDARPWSEPQRTCFWLCSSNGMHHRNQQQHGRWSARCIAFWIFTAPKNAQQGSAQMLAELAKARIASLADELGRLSHNIGWPIGKI